MCHVKPGGYRGVTAKACDCGMVALAAGKASWCGKILNDFPDRYAARVHRLVVNKRFKELLAG